jgi:hypothetical protein
MTALRIRRHQAETSLQSGLRKDDVNANHDRIHMRGRLIV